MPHTLQKIGFYLPKKLKKEIDEERKDTGETLSEYFKNAVIDKLKMEKHKHQRVKTSQ